jgi:CrcB protein
MSATELMTRLLLISGGAALGANARYWLGLWAAKVGGPHFPAGTLLVNVSGSLLLGLLIGLGQSRLPLPDGWRLFLVVGFCGSYTTFSTYAVESIGLFEAELASLAWLNILANNALALTSVLAGLWLARLLS